MKKIIIICVSVFLLVSLAACNQTNENNKKKLDEKVFTQGQTLAQYYYAGIRGNVKKTDKIDTFQQHFQDAYLSDQYDSEEEGVFILTIASLKTNYETYQKEEKKQQDTKKEMQKKLNELQKEFGITYKK